MSVDILMVEDNPDDAALALRALRQRTGSTAVRVLEDGAEALEYVFATERYSGRTGEVVAKVVFLDVKLPLVDGLEVLKRIKSDPRTQRTPVVMMTSSDAEVDRSRAYDLGANSYIVKPVDFDALTSVMLECVSYWLTLNRQPPT
jgi:two-component system, response regulator